MVGRQTVRRELRRSPQPHRNSTRTGCEIHPRYRIIPWMYLVLVNRGSLHRGGSPQGTRCAGRVRLYLPGPRHSADQVASVGTNSARLHRRDLAGRPRPVRDGPPTRPGRLLDSLSKPVEPAATGRAWRPRMHTGHEGAQTRPPTGTAAGVGRTEERHRSRNSPRWGLSARPAARQATRLSRLALCPAASVRPVSKAHRT